MTSSYSFQRSPNEASEHVLKDKGGNLEQALLKIVFLYRPFWSNIGFFGVSFKQNKEQKGLNSSPLSSFCAINTYEE